MSVTSAAKVIAEQQDQLVVNWRIAARRILAEYNCEEVA